MLDRVLCPRLVGRDEQLFLLEDALLAAHGGEGRFVALGGEAGMGKTRLASELAKRARRLGWAVLWGACSEAELPLPYLPLVEALGNYISTEGPGRLAGELGAARRELAQLFPQLGGDEPPPPVGDPAQAKMRLFEAVVALLALPARQQGLLLVIEDVHWADSATRELLDHLARRLGNTRSLLLLTYRSDELDRRHPLAPLVQSWRRSGVAELVSLSSLEPSQAGEMIAAILDDAQIDPAFQTLMHERSDGNPFVLEEMLKEALDRGELFRSGQRWEQRPANELRVPASVRDTILLRLARLCAEDADVLRAAAVLGRSFDYDTLSRVTGASEAAVQRALAVGIAQQLLEELGGGRARYRWRHALTQEAIGDEIVLPRRQQLHGRAADVLSGAGADALLVARHLLGAARFEEAVPACISAADEAEATLAFADALEVLQRALPHVNEPLDRSQLLCRMGRLLWMTNNPSAAAEVLSDGIAGLEQSGEHVEAARYRLVLGRCRWEQNRTEEAHDEFEDARQTLEQYGPSAALALAYMRIGTLFKFELDPRSGAYVRRAVEVATEAGADFERVWSKAFLAASLFDEDKTSEGAALLDESFDEAKRRGYSFVELNIAYNDTWTRLHTLSPDLGGRIAGLTRNAGAPVVSVFVDLATTWILRAHGELTAALDALGQGAAFNTFEKLRWRFAVERAEILLELGELERAAATLPPTSERADLQDIVYDAAPQIRVRLAQGKLHQAVELAQEIADNASRLAPYNDALAVAVEALVDAGRLDEAEAAVESARGRQTTVGSEFLDEAAGRILLARGEAAKAASLLEAVAATAASRGFHLVEWRARILAAQALAGSGRPDAAHRELEAVVGAAGAAGAALIAGHGREAARRLGLSVPERAPSAPIQPELAQAGERLITSMFADVRGYTSLTASTAPGEIHERIGTLYRWAAAEVARHHGFVDKFAGDAVMATFNATGTRVEPVRDALEAALALGGKAALLDLGLGIGISVGPAIVGPAPAEGNISVLGSTTNLAARLQAAAQAGEIVLSEEAHRRVAPWLDDHGLVARSETLNLKGFEEPQPAWRLLAREPPAVSIQLGWPA